MERANSHNAPNAANFGIVHFVNRDDLVQVIAKPERGNEVSGAPVFEISKVEEDVRSGRRALRRIGHGNNFAG
jgi:hypothetical protein